MLRATTTTKLYRIPDADRSGSELLPGDRSRLRAALQTNGSADDPDDFDLLERVPEEFSHGESPQEAGKRAKAIEESIAEHYPSFERLESGSDGDTTKAEDNEE